MIRGLEADTNILLKWVSETSPKLTGANFQSTKEALAQVDKLKAEYQPEKERRYADMMSLLERCAEIEKRLEVEREEASLETSEWKARWPDRNPCLPCSSGLALRFSLGLGSSQEAGKDPDAVGAVLSSVPNGMRPIQKELQTAWESLETSQSGMQTKLESVLILLYTTDRIERLSKKVQLWLKEAEATLAATEDVSTESEAQQGIRSCERIELEAKTMDGVVAELRRLEAAVAHHPEQGQRARALLHPLSDLDAAEKHIGKRAAAAKVLCEAKHARFASEGAEQRSYAMKLFDFNVILQTAEELADYPLKAWDSKDVHSAVLEKAATHAEELRAGRSAHVVGNLGQHVDRALEKHAVIQEKLVSGSSSSSMLKPSKGETPTTPVTKTETDAVEVAPSQPVEAATPGQKKDECEVM